MNELRELRDGDVIWKPMLVFGNTFDGFEYVGPFDSEEEAMEYLKPHGQLGDECVLAHLEPPILGAPIPYIDAEETEAPPAWWNASGSPVEEES